MHRILIALAFVLVALPAWAQGNDQYMTQCLGDDDDLAIAGCTALIQSGQESVDNLADIYYDRGISYRHKGLNDQAIADYNQAIALRPNSAKAYNNRGYAYELKGLRDQSIGDYRTALRLDPNLQEARDNLSRLGVSP
jgi:tetratricopeptide (TPR) repeat protein